MIASEQELANARRAGNRPADENRRDPVSHQEAALGEDAAAMHYVYHSSFSSARTEKELWGPDRPEIHVPLYRLEPEELSLGTRSARPGPLSREQEKALFLRYNYAKYRMQKLLRHRPAGASTDWYADYALWRRRAESIRESLVHANLPLVPAMARRMMNGEVELSELLSEGYMAVLRCIGKFDVSRGFKFSTYACRAILACFHRAWKKGQTRRLHTPMYFSPDMERSDYNEVRRNRQREHAIESVQWVLRENMAGLNETERKVLRQRFPLLATRRRKTLWQVGQSLGLSNERVRQIERRSLEKLRAAIETQITG
ncbi:MAG TPA: sigma-70 family RNA polymerase sigma factor [Phycisphaerae bacterium]|nr:sigma-70 family RNA polymerase sigma factor [Phycisphaerae bacterium]